jgi:hypothetical protein
MSTAVVGVAIAAVLLALGVLMGATEVAAVRARAQTAADAAALAAVSAAPFNGGEGDSCAAARNAAAANAARLDRCDGPLRGGWSLQADVSVSMPVRGLGALGPPVRAHAAAVLEPGAWAEGEPRRPRGASQDWNTD